MIQGVFDEKIKKFWQDCYLPINGSLDVDTLTPTAKLILDRWNSQPEKQRSMSVDELMICTENDILLMRFIIYLKKISKKNGFNTRPPGVGHSFISSDDRKILNKLLAYVYGDNPKNED